MSLLPRSGLGTTDRCSGKTCSRQPAVGYIYAMFQATLKALRFFGLLSLNVFVAVIGTAVLDTAVTRAIPPYTMGAVFAKEIALSIICASLIGFGMWRMWRSEPARWTWVIPSLWFIWGLLAVAGRGIWGPLWGSSASSLGAAEMRSFFLFTVPLIRAVAYSAGAYISSFVFHHVFSTSQQ